VGIAITILMILSFILKEVIYIFNPIFFFLNWVQWVLYNPLRVFFKNSNSELTYKFFNFIFYSGIVPIYWVFIHIVTVPLRFVNAVYFNILLSWTINVYDSLAELINPKLWNMYKKSGIDYIFFWIIGFPIRLTVMIFTNIFAFIEPIMMTGVDIIFPTYTMYHGTTYENAHTNIVRKGRWLVGDGNYVGTGIYFGMSKRVAKFYSDSNTMILVRVTLSFNRNMATNPYIIRRCIGVGIGGDNISKRLPIFWSSIEHWREDKDWFEYCIIQPAEKKLSVVTTWRARPIAIVKDNKLQRVWGGKSTSPSFSSISIILFSWLLLVFILSF
jgi:hypothetical protein